MAVNKKSPATAMRPGALTTIIIKPCQSSDGYVNKLSVAASLVKTYRIQGPAVSSTRFAVSFLHGRIAEITAAPGGTSARMATESPIRTSACMIQPPSPGQAKSLPHTKRLGQELYQSGCVLDHTSGGDGAATREHRLNDHDEHLPSERLKSGMEQSCRRRLP